MLSFFFYRSMANDMIDKKYQRTKGVKSYRTPWGRWEISLVVCFHLEKPRITHTKREFQDLDSYTSPPVCSYHREEIHPRNLFGRFWIMAQVAGDGSRIGWAP